MPSIVPFWPFLECARHTPASNQVLVQVEGGADCGIPLAALSELLERQFAVLVLVHHVEDLGDPLLRGVLVLWQLNHAADHLVDGVHDLEHLVVGDVPVVVDVVELEGPDEFLVHLSSRGDGEGADELFEIYRAVLVVVKDVEDVVGKGARVAKGKELLVDLLKVLLAQLSRGTVLQETLVPSKMRELDSQGAQSTSTTTQHGTIADIGTAE